MYVLPLHNRKEGAMRIAGLMSGSGSNLVKIIEHQKKLESEKGSLVYEVVVIFTDNEKSRASEIGKNYNIPVVTRDLKSFCGERGKKKTDLSIRPEFDQGTVEALAPYKAAVAAYAGYMSIATEPLIKAFLGINVHPADLSIEENNERKYRGAHVVGDAILAGEKYISSTMHIIEPKVDEGRILMISSPLEVKLGEGFDPNNKEVVNKVADENQERLKEKGDWVIFPKTLEYIADGRYAMDLWGSLYFDGKPIPKGLKLK